MAKLSEAKAWAKHDLHGYFTVMTTPFNDDLSVNYEGLRENVKRLSELECVTGFYCHSVFQEAPSLEPDERRRITETVVDATGPDQTVVVAIGAVPVGEAVSLAQHAEQVGADMLLLWPPLFGHRSREGVTAYFRQVIESVQMPIAIYRSGLDEFGYLSSVEEIQTLVEYDNVCALKEASMSLTKYLILLEAVGDDIAVSSSLDEYYVVGKTLYPALAPDFVLGSARTLFAETLKRPCLTQLHAAVKQGDSAAIGKALGIVVNIANALHTKFLEQGSHNIALSKAVSEMVGLVGGPVRPPLSKPSDADLASAHELLKEFDLI